MLAGEFTWEASFQAPMEWGPSRTYCTWKLQAPAWGVNDAPAAFHRPQKKHRLNFEEPMKRAGLRCQVSTPAPSLCYVLRKAGSAVGAFTAHMEDILGCGEQDVLNKIRQLSGEQFGKLQLQESSFVHAGLGLSRESDFSVILTQYGFAQNLQPPPTCP